MRKVGPGRHEERAGRNLVSGGKMTYLDKGPKRLDLRKEHASRRPLGKRAASTM